MQSNWDLAIQISESLGLCRYIINHKDMGIMHKDRFLGLCGGDRFLGLCGGEFLLYSLDDFYLCQKRCERCGIPLYFNFSVELESDIMQRYLQQEVADPVLFYEYRFKNPTGIPSWVSSLGGDIKSLHIDAVRYLLEINN